ncbi:hypothetical protein [Nocardia sp. NPDC057668]|uniref:hypothetical protein n=1 Tax=Nocardia sp. NPDC057668 TaxID=3346202 RepID=UPI003671EE4A
MTVEVVVMMLIAWAVGRANRAGQQINGLADDALDLAVTRVRDAVASKLGGDVAIQRLLAEARATNGGVSHATRAEAERALYAAITRDGRFAADLQRITATPEQPAVPPPSGGDNYGVQGIWQTGDGSIKISNKVVQQAKRHPLAAFLIVVALLGLLGAAVDQLLSAAQTTTADPGPGNPSVDSQTIVGTWTASDGTGTKTYTSNSGQCDGFYYNNGRPLDIGGPMTCTISSRPDTQGRYTMIVTQSDNRAEYRVEFSDTNHAAVLDSKGTKIYEIERF